MRVENSITPDKRVINMFANEETERDFCDFLEYRICEYLYASIDPKVKGFWCDGVLFDTNELATENKDSIACTAFTGKTGQDEYKLILSLGEKSLELLSKGRDIKSCVPKTIQTDAFRVDTKKKLIQIYTL